MADLVDYYNVISSEDDTLFTDYHAGDFLGTEESLFWVEVIVWGIIFLATLSVIFFIKSAFKNTIK
jgi:hypothetical protein